MGVVPHQLGVTEDEMKRVNVVAIEGPESQAFCRQLERI
jgi:hypothetical protein